MAPTDEKDLGIRTGQEWFGDLADKMDREIGAILARHEADITTAGTALKGGDHETAAVCYERVAASFTAAHLGGLASQWTDRAASCRKEGAFVARRAAKLKVHDARRKGTR